MFATIKFCFIYFILFTSDIPDPPLNVQAEAGPREETLLLTWLPVTITSSGFSNGAVVTGYAIFADGNRLKEAPGPTSKWIKCLTDKIKRLCILPSVVQYNTIQYKVFNIF